VATQLKALRAKGDTTTTIDQSVIDAVGKYLPTSLELSQGNTVSSLAHKFLKKMHNKQCVPEGWLLESLKMEDAPLCGIPAKCHFVIRENLMRLGMHFEPRRDLHKVPHAYQWYRAKVNMSREL
jgi:hypothetical protein